MNNNFYPPNNGYPFNGGSFSPPSRFNTVDAVTLLNQKHGLRRLSVTAGACVLGFIVLETLVSFILMFTRLYNVSQNNALFQSAFGSVTAVICVFLPFLIAALFMDSQKRNEILAFGKPYSTGLMLLAVPAGFMFCMVGNYATNFLVTLMKSVGVTLTSPDLPAPTSLLGVIMYLIQIAILPPLIEEFALRGVIMQPLRKYGDWFAIVMSALVFALMHGNMVQAPFAFIAGIAIGYFVIETGSIWTGVLIHFSNNLYSSLFSLADSNSQTVQKVYMVIMTIVFVGGLTCLVSFLMSSKRQKLRKMDFPMKLSDKLGSYLLTLPMIISLIAIAVLTKQYIKFGG